MKKGADASAVAMEGLHFRQYVTLVQLTPQQVVAMVQLGVGDEQALKQTVATIGPMTTDIDGDQQSLHFYRDGVHNNCLKTVPNHAVPARLDWTGASRALCG